MTTETTLPSQIVFIDGSLANIDELLAGLAPGVQAVMLDPTRDGVAQIAAALAGMSGLAAIHIVSHGAEGTLHLGATVLDAESLVRYEAQLAAIGAALADSGDLMLYGCDVAAGDSGQSFITELSVLTGADVAASNDLTGSALFDGDWVLEASAGSIETTLPFAADALAQWQGTLDVITGDGNANNLIGTANADTISGLGGNDTLSGGGGNDLLDGGSGTDTANYGQMLTGYSFGLDTGNRLTVTDTDTGNGDDGTDTLIDIEQAAFTGATVSIRQFAEHRVDTTADQQSYPAAATLADGGYVVTWSSGVNPWDIYARRYAADGTALGDEFPVSTNGHFQSFSAIAALADGGWVVTWMSDTQDGSNGGIYARRYDANGAPVASETRINTTTLDDQDYPDITALMDGGWVVTWESNSQDGSGFGIYAQRYAANGSTVGVEKRVNTTTLDNQQDPAVAALADGGYVVTWKSGVGLGIYAQRYAADDIAQGGEIRIDSGQSGAQYGPDIVALADGGWVVTWHSYQDENGGGYGIYARRYLQDGTAAGGEARVNTTTAEFQNNPAIAALADGGWVVTWMSNLQDGSGYGIYAQRYDANGAALGSETRINTTTLNSQIYPDITAMADGGWLITWHGNGPGNSYGIFAQRYDASGNAIQIAGDAGANWLAASGPAGISLDGGAGNDTLTGADGTDGLDGGTGADSLAGGAGDDFYVVDDPLDIVTEAPDAGNDRVSSSAASYTLPNNVEQLALAGTGNITGTGNSAANRITGNSGDNALDGTGGNDTLVGGGGADTLAGGTGDDLFHIDSTDDVVTENASEGTDAISSSASYTLPANVEHLTLTGTADIDGTGNAGANTLFGNRGDNLLDGGCGIDTVSYAGPLAGYVFGSDGYRRLNITDIDPGNGQEGSDTLVNIEEAAFSDATLSLLSYAETRVNTSTHGNQYYPSIAALPDGGYVIAWFGGHQGSIDAFDVLLQRYAVDGSAIGVETRVNATAEGWEEFPAVAALADGGWVVTWYEWETVGSDINIYAQRYDAAGALVGGETRINTTTANWQYYPVVAGLADGGYVVAWQSNNQDGDSLGIYAQRYSAAGAALGTETRVNTITAGDQTSPEVIALADGGWLVTWDGPGGAFAQRYAADGSTVGGETLVRGSSASALADGGWVMAWSSYAGSGVFDISFQHYAPDGSTVGNETRANTTNADQPHYSVVTALADGGWVVTWDSNLQDGSARGIYAQRFDANGAAVGSETRVNWTTAGNQDAPAVAALADGGWVLTWQSELQDGSGYGIYAQRYDADGSTTMLTGDTGSNSLIWGGLVDIRLEGDAGNDTLSGALGNDTLDGGADNDSLSGGAGNDTYVIDSVSDVVQENLGKGTDIVQASVTYALPANVENLTLTGSASIDGTGSDIDNLLTGNSGNNMLDGGPGADTMIGGAGNDTYVLDALGDVVVEQTGAGTDTVRTGLAVYALNANVENLVLTGTTAIEGYGNTLANRLTGNVLGNILDGGAGADTMEGGRGDDTYIVDNPGDIVIEANASGNDVIESSISYTLPINIEYLQLTGDSPINGTGNFLSNILFGNSADNILNGGLNDDIMIGGPGNDVYKVDNPNDIIIELPGEGNDRVESTISFDLGANVEDLTLESIQIDDVTLLGNGDNAATGNELPNVLIGNSGHNVLDGRGGNDTMSGGLGNDTYIVEQAYIDENDTGDVVTEQINQGTDLVRSTLNSYTLGDNFENLTLEYRVEQVGEVEVTVWALEGTGNELDNLITGNDADNTLVGGAGDDTLDGGKGADTMIGGTGDDDYFVDNAGDQIVEFADEGRDAVFIDFRDGAAWNNTFRYTLPDHVEDAFYSFGSLGEVIGNALDNQLKGNDGANTLVGGGGNDTLEGGKGNDVYVVAEAGDQIIEGGDEGVDTVEASIGLTLGSNLENLVLTGGATAGTGNALGNHITGNASLANVLNGGAGVDTLVGGLGDDIYQVDTAADAVFEAGGQGYDTVESLASYILAANIEKLKLLGNDNLNGNGNTLDNLLLSNAGNNNLDGNSGQDIVSYEAAGAGVTVNLVTGQATGGGGTDTLINVEGVVGTVYTDTLTGNNGANILDGGIGADSMVGGTGNDVYYVDNENDVVDEINNTPAPGGGLDLSLYAGVSDTVNATVSYSLGAFVENLLQIGTTNINGTGNALKNWMEGNDGNNTLQGLGEADTLIGGLGNDTLDGGTGDDSIEGGVGNDSLEGGAGIDTATFAGLKANYAVARVGGSYTVTANVGSEGVDTLTNVEKLKFSDETVTLAKVVSDYNGDGKSDILIRNDSTGVLFQFQMNGTAIGGTGVVPNAGTAWKVVGNGDYNGDGKSDILIRNDSTGVLVQFRMDGTTIVGMGVVDSPGTDWKVVGNGDYNGDGKSDILMRNDSTGVIFQYQMNGMTYASTAVVDSPGTDWKVVGSGDYNGDGKSDILIRNDSTGVLFQFQMNGTAIGGTGVVPNAGTIWKVVGNGDFNGDGKSDILIRNDSTGVLVQFQMNGTAIVGMGVVDSPGTAWKVAGTGDYNGDGKSDILMRNDSTGVIFQYQMNGMTYAGTAVVDSPGTEWGVVG